MLVTSTGASVHTELGAGLLELDRVDVADSDGGAFGDQLLRSGVADATRAAGDGDNFSLDFSLDRAGHGNTPFLLLRAPRNRRPQALANT